MYERKKERKSDRAAKRCRDSGMRPKGSTHLGTRARSFFLRRCSSRVSRKQASDSLANISAKSLLLNKNRKANNRVLLLDERGTRISRCHSMIGLGGR